MLPSELSVFIVDDDAAVRDALGLLLGIRGYRTAVFGSGEDFLRAWKPGWVGCLLIDIRMPGMDGLVLQQKLVEMDCAIPVIVITGHGEISLARQAFKARAMDFLEKPIDDAQLILAIEEAFRRESQSRLEIHRRQHALERQQKLTPRERQVLKEVVSGRHNRQIAEELTISVRTVEVHKARLMAKLGVDNIPDLVKISMEAFPE